MKKLILFPLVFFALLIIGVLLAYFNKQAGQILNPNINSFNQNLTKTTPEPTPRPLERFTFANLAQTQFNGREIVLERKLTDMYEEEEQVGFKSYLFSYLWDDKKITGLLNMPMTPKSNKMPVVVLLRGYVDETIYETGIGTKKAAGVFAQQGAITLAPDF
ncbi:hypothetical protein GYA19_05940, partial [Candidatus Beckwithbacteria bacterium]|nr:hypothetical protein [Candidatus Beckwithbacteria bacterium]